MPLVKVWNDNQFDHTEKFKGQEITIKAGGYVELDYIDAVDFRGQFIPPKMLGPNNPDPRFFKMIRVEEPAEPVVKEDKNVFHATGKAFGSPSEVIALAKAYAHLNPDLVASDPELEKALSGKRERDPDRDDLLARIATLEAAVARSKPGPKPKEKVAI